MPMFAVVAVAVAGVVVIVVVVAVAAVAVTVAVTVAVVGVAAAAAGVVVIVVVVVVDVVVVVVVVAPSLPPFFLLFFHPSLSSVLPFLPSHCFSSLSLSFLFFMLSFLSALGNPNNPPQRLAPRAKQIDWSPAALGACSPKAGPWANGVGAHP